MDGRVNVRVVTRNRIGGEEETLRFAGEGVLRRRPGGWLLHYDAVSETDGTVTESSVRLTDEPIHIALRSGARRNPAPWLLRAACAGRRRG